MQFNIFVVSWAFMQKSFFHILQRKMQFFAQKGKNWRGMQPENSREIIGRRNFSMQPHKIFEPIVIPLGPHEQKCIKDAYHII